MSSWLQRKSPEQQQLMKEVRSLGPQLHSTHCQQQLIVWHEIAEEMEKKKQQEEEATTTEKSHYSNGHIARRALPICTRHHVPPPEAQDRGLKNEGRKSPD